MKRYLSIIFMMFLLLLSCRIEDSHEVHEINQLDIFYINDLHGALKPSESSIGIAYMAHMIEETKNDNSLGTLVFLGGDILQGSLLSDLTYGKVTIDIMNEIGVDAMVIGNHEFDWGLETVTRYFDYGEEHRATFPLLGANVFSKKTNSLPNGIDPYTIIERGNLRIGVIGTIEYGIESTIMAKHIEDYTFKDPAPIVEDLSYYLRTEENVDIVILITHDRGTVNQRVVHFDENSRVDAIFNGHSHWVFTRFENQVPVMQSGGYGSHLGHMNLMLSDNKITDIAMTNHTRENQVLLSFPNFKVTNLLNEYDMLLGEDYFDPIIHVHESITQESLTYWIASLMAHTFKADIALHNSGGTRRELISNTVIDYETLYEIWPFNNEIVTTMILGSDLKAFLNITQWRDAYIGVDFIEDDELYRLVTHDFIYYRNHYTFLRKQDNLNHKGIYLRDLAYHELQKQSLIYSNFSEANPFLLPYYYDSEFIELFD